MYSSWWHNKNPELTYCLYWSCTTSEHHQRKKIDQTLCPRHNLKSCRLKENNNTSCKSYRQFQSANLWQKPEPEFFNSLNVRFLYCSSGTSVFHSHISDCSAYLSSGRCLACWENQYSINFFRNKKSPVGHKFCDPLSLLSCRRVFNNSRALEGGGQWLSQGRSFSFLREILIRMTLEFHWLATSTDVKKLSSTDSKTIFAQRTNKAQKSWFRCWSNCAIFPRVTCGNWIHSLAELSNVE